jgi:hypothetical protein
MIKKVDICSARDGVVLTLSDFVYEDGSADSETFVVSVRGYQLGAEIKVSSVMAPNLADYFLDLSEHWRGWKGEKKWATLEGEFSLIATADSTGHTTLNYCMRSPYTGFHWELRGALELDVGQLESLAKNVQVVWL